MSAIVFMKAMPPTRGHRALIEYAYKVSHEVYIVIDYARDEPMIGERIAALKEIQGHRLGDVLAIPFNYYEGDDDYWPTWNKILEIIKTKFEPTYLVGSELYCVNLADKLGARFIPYDLDREFISAKGTEIRRDPILNFKKIDSSFQKHLRTTVTIFGAESNGKSTLTKDLAYNLGNPPHLFEWARPYLSQVDDTISVESMETIWKGQKALQEWGQEARGNPLVLQDTDLFTTVGYWEQPHQFETLGYRPYELVNDAVALQSDLYVVARSNIPFEKDKIRYAGDRRESPDEYWIGVCEKYGLNYVVLESSKRDERVDEIAHTISRLRYENAHKIAYDRKGNV